ncbi:hypothetical protein ACP4OV_012838 [Aristida adscensionis]
MQRTEGERCLRTADGDLKTCTGADGQVSGKRTSATARCCFLSINVSIYNEPMVQLFFHAGDLL